MIQLLDRQGYLYYNSFDVDPDGGATIQAIHRATGQLRTLHIAQSGQIDIQGGWKQ